MRTEQKEKVREWKMSNEAEEQLSSSFTGWKWLLTGGAAHLHPPLSLSSLYPESTNQNLHWKHMQWYATIHRRLGEAPTTISDVLHKNVYHCWRHYFKTRVYIYKFLQAQIY